MFSAVSDGIVLVVYDQVEFKSGLKRRLVPARKALSGMGRFKLSCGELVVDTVDLEIAGVESNELWVEATGKRQVDTDGADG